MPDLQRYRRYRNAVFFYATGLFTGLYCGSTISPNRISIAAVITYIALIAANRVVGVRR